MEKYKAIKMGVNPEILISFQNTLGIQYRNLQNYIKVIQYLIYYWKRRELYSIIHNHMITKRADFNSVTIPVSHNLFDSHINKQVFIDFIKLILGNYSYHIIFFRTHILWVILDIITCLPLF